MLYFFRNSGKLIYISVNHPPEAQQIKSIHLCSIPQPDILIWPEVNSGDYSIKTDYKALQEKPTLAADEIEASEEKKKVLERHLETLSMEIVYKLCTH